MCDVVMDLLVVRVCEQRQRNDCSGRWDTTECHSRTTTNRSSVMLAFDSGCTDGRYYRTAARWWKDGWGGGDLNYVPSASVQY